MKRVRGRFTRPQEGLPDMDRWAALWARHERRVRARGLYPWLHLRYRWLGHHIHRRVWFASWGVLIAGVLVLVLDCL